MTFSKVIHLKDIKLLLCSSSTTHARETSTLHCNKSGDLFLVLACTLEENEPCLSYYHIMPKNIRQYFKLQFAIMQKFDIDDDQISSDFKILALLSDIRSI